MYSNQLLAATARDKIRKVNFWGSNMPLTFNSLLTEVGLDLKTTRLLRHQDTDRRHRSPYIVWRDDKRDGKRDFDYYQSHQSPTRRKDFKSATHWASFVATPSSDTLFVGLYEVEYEGLSAHQYNCPVSGTVREAGMGDFYRLKLLPDLSEYVGIMFVDWGASARAWIQRADRQNKPIIELRRHFQEDEFPGFGDFISSLSDIGRLPSSWVQALRSVRGIYLLTCPRTKELYVGSATGEDGFYGRWLQYLSDGHGGNIQLRSREPSDYQISILEVCGSAVTGDEVVMIESLWKKKLQSREMGLNSN